MKDGVIHQVGAPLDIYEHPVNRFVAGFVGTPPMNFFEGRITRQSDALYFEDGAHRLKIPNRLAPTLARHVDHPIVMGVRPEALRVGPAVEGGSIRAQVTVTETLGDRIDVYFDTAGPKHLVCRVDSRVRVVENHPADIQIDMDRVHFFDPADQGRSVSSIVAT
jgi:multiple sugar transport system ATP-binding protein